MDRASRLYTTKTAKSSNTDFLCALIDEYLQTESADGQSWSNQSSSCCNVMSEVKNHVTMFVTEGKQLDEYVQHVQEHGKLCAHRLGLQSEERSGHVLCRSYVCCKNHRVLFQLSSKEGDFYSANMRLMLGYMCSSMLEMQYNKMCTFSKLGNISDRQKTKMMESFSPVVKQLAKESVSNVRTEELMMAHES